jgi:transposase
MNLHLAEIAKAVAQESTRSLLVDQAGWHLSARLVVPANITIIPPPPKCPELNPVEKIWQYMRDTWLSNRVFKSYHDIVDHRCHRTAPMGQEFKSTRLGIKRCSDIQPSNSASSESSSPWSRLNRSSRSETPMELRSSPLTSRTI